MGCDERRGKERCRRNVGRVAGPGDDEVVVEVCCSRVVWQWQECPVRSCPVSKSGAFPAPVQTTVLLSSKVHVPNQGGLLLQL
jgi:hypothetical protein